MKNLHHQDRVPAPNKPVDKPLRFIDHVYELKRRLFYVALSVIFFTTAGYFIQHQLVHFLLLPAKGQRFIYTTPGGGFNFLFQICIYFGILLSVPVIIYQILRYIEPLIHSQTKRVVAYYSFFSVVLALFGAAFGYFIGLPTALQFLSHQFTTQQIQPLLTIQEYMSFVILYLIGSAFLFQIPLIILFINRIKPISPRKLLGFERYLIVCAFIAAAIMTPTTDIFNQLLFAGPIIITYQIAVVLVYLKNRKKGLRNRLVSTKRSQPQSRASKQPAFGPRFGARPAIAPLKARPARLDPSLATAFGSGGYSSNALPQLNDRLPLKQTSRIAWDIVDPYSKASPLFKNKVSF